MTGILVIIVAIFILAGLGAIFNLITDARTNTVEDNFILATNTTSINGTVQLSSQLWEALISNASVSSNLTSDTPAITSYTNGNRALNMNGLATNTTRLLTIEYKTAGLDGYSGADAGIKFFPVAFIIGAVFLPLIAVIYIVLGR